MSWVTSGFSFFINSTNWRMFSASFAGLLFSTKNMLATAFRIFLKPVLGDFVDGNFVVTEIRYILAGH